MFLIHTKSYCFSNINIKSWIVKHIQRDIKYLGSDYQILLNDNEINYKNSSQGTERACKILEMTEQSGDDGEHQWVLRC